MQITGTFLLVWVLSVLSLGVFTSDNVVAPSSAPVNVAFERLKGLSGTWEVKSSQGKKVTGTFRVVSAGSAVMLIMDEGSADNMVTMFNLDGDSSVIVTHYCSAKNQPRFVLAESKDPNALVFEFKDITNLASPGAGHMRGLKIRFKDADHHTEEWTWREKGKDMVEAMEFVRKK